VVTVQLGAGRRSVVEEERPGTLDEDAALVGPSDAHSAIRLTSSPVSRCPPGSCGQSEPQISRSGHAATSAAQRRRERPGLRDAVRAGELDPAATALQDAQQPVEVRLRQAVGLEARTAIRRT
jgi:hypothetical protein